MFDAKIHFRVMKSTILCLVASSRFQTSPKSLGVWNRKQKNIWIGSIIILQGSRHRFLAYTKNICVKRVRKPKGIWSSNWKVQIESSLSYKYGKSHFDVIVGRMMDFPDMRLELHNKE